MNIPTWLIWGIGIAVWAYISLRNTVFLNNFFDIERLILGLVTFVAGIAFVIGYALG